MLPFGKIFKGYADAAYRRGQRDALVHIRKEIDKLLEEDNGDSDNAVRSGTDLMGPHYYPEDV